MTPFSEPHRFLLLPVVLMLAGLACTEAATDAPPEASDPTDAAYPEGFPYEELQAHRWIYQVARREAEPPGGYAWWALFDGDGQNRPIRRARTRPAVDLTWENVGRYTSGNVVSYAFDPQDGRTLWVGSAGGGLWKTIDAGARWQPMTDRLPSLSVSAVAVHPRQANVVLIGTDDAFGPGGHLVPGLARRRRFGVGVLRSSDGGRTWRPTTLFRSRARMNVYALVWSSVQPNPVYLAGSTGLWTSVNAGVAWQRILVGDARSVVLHPQDPSVLYAGVAASDEADHAAPGVYRSTDGGRTWMRLTNGLPADDAYRSGCGACVHLSISAGSPDVLYASFQLRIEGKSQEQVFKTTDGGAQWSLVLTDTALETRTGKSETVWFVSVSPAAPEVAFAGGIRLFRTRDGGVTWERVGQLETFDTLYFKQLDEAVGSWIHVDHHAVAFDPADPDRVYALTDGGVFVSADGGDRWQRKNRGLMTLQLYAIGSALTDTLRLAASTQDQGNLVYHGRGDNARWRKWVTGDAMGALFDHTNHNILHGVSQRGNHWQFMIPLDSLAVPDPTHVYRAQDGLGGTGTGLWETPMVMDPDVPQRLYTATRDAVFTTTWDGTVYGGGNTTNVSWTTLVAIDSVSVLALDQQNPAIVYAYAGKEKEPSLWRSADAGENWDRLAYASDDAWPGAYVSDLEADPDTEGTLYATRAGYGSQVWRSTDRGETWIDITTDLPAIPVNTVAVTPASTVERKQIYVGTDVGVFMTYAQEHPARLVWRRVEGGLPYVQVDDMHIHPVDRTLRVGTYGRGFWKAPLPGARPAGPDPAAPPGRGGDR